MVAFYRMSNQTPSCQLYPLEPYVDEHALPREGHQGVCPVCGEVATFTRFTPNLRESGNCSVCYSYARQRQLALMIRRRLFLAPAGPLTFPAGFALYNVESSGPMHDQLKASPGYVFSDFFGDQYRGGELINGVRHEDLEKLSFADESLDLVISSEVLEHMPSPYDAHREIFRVLKPGGRHIFTVPFNPAAPLDDTRARMVDGKIEYLAEKQFHEDPVRPGEGILVWTIFGLEMMTRLEAVGFSATAWNLYEPDFAIFGNCNTIFEARKPPLSPGPVIAPSPAPRPPVTLMQPLSVRVLRRFKRWWSGR